MSFRGCACGLCASRRMECHSGERRSCMSQKPAMSDSKGQFSCGGEERFSCFAVFGRWGVEDMERLHEDALVLMDTRHTCLLTMDTQIYIGDKMS